MSKMDIGFHSLPMNARRNTCLIGIGILVSLQTILMITAVIILAGVQPEIKNTLIDVNEMIPEMRRSLLDLGQMLPEIREGMQILKSLCDSNDQCTVQYIIKKTNF
jgi:hypothetical protein|tara:strand:- start:216 stop:533 length:318 start_codon:yes stop_codon:yes gene_type:complete